MKFEGSAHNQQLADLYRKKLKTFFSAILPTDRYKSHYYFYYLLLEFVLLWLFIVLLGVKTQRLTTGN